MAINWRRRDLIKWSGLAAVIGAMTQRGSAATRRVTHKRAEQAKLPDRVVQYLRRLYAEGSRAHAFRDGYPGGFDQWQKASRPVLRRLIGLDTIAMLAGNHKPTVQLDASQDLGEFTRRRGVIDTEPDVRIPFWLLKPKGRGPFPLAVLPHGHNSRGLDIYAGVYHSDVDRRRALAEDRDVAVQAVKRGFLAVAPATRGLAADGVPDVFKRHGERDCRSHVMHCLLAGRTAIGERVWDMQRIIDWAAALPDVDAKHVLMMGNSGGGMVTTYASACDERITIAVPSCSFSVLVSGEGRIYHCDCNMVPGLLAFGDLYDVAGLIAPRHLLTVNGRQDTLHSVADITRAAARVRAIYTAAGHPDRYEHRFGDAGHRFYKDLMWPFVMKALEG
jgi:dienelactone hydrolase